MITNEELYMMLECTVRAVKLKEERAILDDGSQDKLMHWATPDKIMELIEEIRMWRKLHT